MDRLSFINSVYEKISDRFVRDVSDANAPRLKEAYLSYLHNAFDAMFQKAGDNELEQIASICAGKEKLLHLDLDEEAKIAFLFPDEQYLRLEQISLEIAAQARAKKKGQQVTPARTKEEYLSEISDLMENISERYQYTARRIYSETVVDLVYLFDDESIQSFRTSMI